MNNYSDSDMFIAVGSEDWVKIRKWSRTPQVVSCFSENLAKICEAGNVDREERGKRPTDREDRLDLVGLQRDEMFGLLAVDTLLGSGYRKQLVFYISRDKGWHASEATFVRLMKAVLSSEGAGAMYGYPYIWDFLNPGRISPQSCKSILMTAIGAKDPTKPAYADADLEVVTIKDMVNHLLEVSAPALSTEDLMDLWNRAATPHRARPAIAAHGVARGLNRYMLQSIVDTGGPEDVPRLERMILRARVCGMEDAAGDVEEWLTVLRIRVGVEEGNCGDVNDEESSGDDLDKKAGRVQNDEMSRGEKQFRKMLWANPGKRPRRN